jgi:succinoglycan biosynthesis protein ExoO
MSQPQHPNSAPRVTVAIPVYNSSATLARCIRSAMEQTMRDIEILVADDCSTDDSAAIAEALAAEDPRIRVIRLSPNGGKPRAMNTMIAAARGEWVAVLDADDAYHPQRLARLVAAAEARGVEMAADNLLYVDAGIGRALRTGFDRAIGPRIIAKQDLVQTANTYASFDYGVLKPVVRRDFLRIHGLTYYEHTRLAEDFYYLLSFFVAGGRACLLSDPLYYWTLPFGTVSRKWTGTGGGPWRYDYRPALKANQHFIKQMQKLDEADVVAMLRRRSREYTAMIHYLDAQRLFAERRRLACIATIIAHPSTYRLLTQRVAGRIRHRLVGTKHPDSTSYDQHDAGAASLSVESMP